MVVNETTPDEIEDVTICSEELPYDWNGRIITEAGTHTNPVTDANGCEYDEILNLVVNATTPDAIEDITICGEELPYDWNGIIITEAGTHTNPVTDANGCEYEEILNLVVNATTPDAIEDVTICLEELPCLLYTSPSPRDS